MKQFISMLALLSISVSSWAQFHVGAGYSYGTGVREGAPQLRLMYSANNRWAAAFDGNFYLDSYENLSFYEANFNVNYTLLVHDRIVPYVLAGANAYMETLEGVDTFFEPGINTGVGLRVRPASFLQLFTETRYTISDANQFCISGGLLFKI